MGTSYVPEIFVPSEKRILSPSFHDGHFIPPSGFSPAAAPTRKMPVRKLCHVPVWYRIRFSVLLCDVQAAFFGRKAACTGRMLNGLRRVEEALNRWTRKALDDAMPGDLFLARRNACAGKKLAIGSLKTVISIFRLPFVA